jgi:hypothetical protein
MILQCRGREHVSRNGTEYAEITEVVILANGEDKNNIQLDCVEYAGMMFLTRCVVVEVSTVR